MGLPMPGGQRWACPRDEWDLKLLVDLESLVQLGGRARAALLERHALDAVFVLCEPGCHPGESAGGRYNVCLHFAVLTCAAQCNPRSRPVARHGDAGGHVRRDGPWLVIGGRLPFTWREDAVHPNFGPLAHRFGPEDPLGLRVSALGDRVGEQHPPRDAVPD